MELKKFHLIGIIGALILLVVDIIFFRNDPLFYFLFGIAIVILFLPFVVNIITESKVARDKDERFLEFARNLAESVKTGTPIGKSILNMRTRNFGVLTPHVEKLANQISLGIPLSKAFETFSYDTGSIAIRRAVNLFKEAESAGGRVDKILDSVANSIYQIEKLKKERKAGIASLVVQGYLIFFIFIAIMLIMQFKVLPITEGLGNLGAVTSFENPSDPDLNESGFMSIEKLTRPFLYLLLIQGFFIGLTIGKLSDGTLRAGIKHSFAMMLAAFLISTGANAYSSAGI
jgi:flagellar protein FlaJ